MICRTILATGHILMHSWSQFVQLWNRNVQLKKVMCAVRSAEILVKMMKLCDDYQDLCSCPYLLWLFLVEIWLMGNSRKCEWRCCRHIRL